MTRHLTPVPDPTEGPTTEDALTVDQLSTAIENATSGRSAFGETLSGSKAVILRVNGAHYPLRDVAISAVGGEFVLILGDGSR